MQETEEMQAQSLGQEDPLEKEIATHSSILVWEIPWTEEPACYSPWGRTESNATQSYRLKQFSPHTYTHTHLDLFRTRLDHSGSSYFICTWEAEAGLYPTPRGQSDEYQWTVWSLTLSPCRSGQV